VVLATQEEEELCLRIGFESRPIEQSRRVELLFDDFEDRQQNIAIEIWSGANTGTTTAQLK